MTEARMPAGVTKIVRDDPVKEGWSHIDVEGDGNVEDMNQMTKDAGDAVVSNLFLLRGFYSQNDFDFTTKTGSWEVRFKQNRENRDG
jgi:hypothetical protein